MRHALAIVVLAGCATAMQEPTPPRAPDAMLAAVEASADLDGALVGPSLNVTIVVTFASWCGHCHHELAILAGLRASHPTLRVLGVNYIAHEEYGGRGGADTVRAYLARHAPWMRVVPAGEALFARLGSPPKIPTLFVFDRGGALVETYDRRERESPDASELAALLRRLGE